MNKIKKLGLTLTFAFQFTLVMMLTLYIVLGGILLLNKTGLLKTENIEDFSLFWFSLVFLIVGMALSAYLSYRSLAPLRELIAASDKISKGDYSIRINLQGPDEFVKLSSSFNHMAQELSSVEMLRTDFVNNFSHEFKTPIVSIRGFAKILKSNDLTEEERNEYLDIIINESERLSELSASVLNLSRIEQQTILTEQKRFNVSEQIRLVIAMMYSKWADKHIDISFDSEEIYAVGNEEMLKQVWINLIDNAIKFSPEYGKVDVKAVQSQDKIIFTFTDSGKGMSEKTAAHIFDKFYQGDTSHSVKGTGLGLTIAKKIIELHGGTIHVSSTGSNGSVFKVKIPNDKNKNLFL
ncbi:MAG: ATP-binding protein [Porcipelethomonas sp.]